MLLPSGAKLAKKFNLVLVSQTKALTLKIVGTVHFLKFVVSVDHKQRINVEQHCQARDAVNIIPCEGADRVERHELLGIMEVTVCYRLSTLVNSTIKTLLGNYSDKYRLEERDGALYLGWMKRDLVASCAWK
ncbi:unnamed protein product [Eruca vesicaria subsp. sativa]|uniref:Uncharacterized protein n=1 Tax=Eruca vesicaria subsp. sativa TaxID=29727 RepID=A0ABC8K5U2_ERUVS|nr:unnamed protein product [Eruca vesicaria subsp. sativa]